MKCRYIGIAGRHYHAPNRADLEPGDVVELTPRQFNSFKDRFERVVEVAESPEPETEEELEEAEEPELIAEPSGGGWFHVFDNEGNRLTDAALRRDQVTATYGEEVEFR
jgi:hypothetical protein